MICPCPVSGCDRDATEWLVCRACAARLERDLAEVAHMAAQVRISLARASAGVGHTGPRSVSPPLAYNQRASAALGALKAVLVGWVRDLGEREHPWPADTEAACASWLLARSAILRMHPAAGDICSEVHTAMDRCRRAIDNPAERVFAGPCSDCGAPLYAEKKAAMVICRTAGCHAAHDVATCRVYLRAAAEDHLLTIPEMLRVLPNWFGVALTDSTLRSWRHRGQLVHHGLSMAGKETFRVGDVLDLLAATEARSA